MRRPPVPPRYRSAKDQGPEVRADLACRHLTVRESFGTRPEEW